MGDELSAGIAPLLEQDPRVGDGGAAGGVGRHGADLLERLARAPYEQQRPNVVLRRDGAAGQDAQAGRYGEGRDGHQPDVGGAGGEAVSTLRGKHPVDLIAPGKFLGPG